ncbi:glutamate-gated chloride channel isoform X11 [Palaemon carinicauda]|uniref:glutamate-gated chloride channel isoform X11 n=1 Tax=Palaemon carinicauda TaxID=392227 RepID=UPI0035B635F3
MEGASRGVVGLETLALVVILTLCCFCCCLTTVQASEYFMESSDKEILDFLLHKSRYDRRIRPPVEEGPLKVNVSVLLLSLSSPDESSLKYEVELLLHQHWLDPRLKHDDAGRHPYLSGIHHINDMWLPDTYFIMHGEFKTDLSKDDIALKIYSDGKVSYTIRRYLVLSCEGNLNKFPFDDPFCTFSMESISYERHELTYAWLNNTASGNGTSLAKSSNLRALNAYMIKNRTLFCEETFFWRGDYSCLKVELEFTRDDAFYLSTVFFPGMVLVTSSFITFWLEWNAVPARVMIGVTTMLNFFTTSNSFRSTLPVVSNLSAMNLWDSVCMFFIYVSLLEFVVVNYVGRKRPKHNMAYMPGENAVIQVLSENRHRIPQAIHRIGLSLVSGWDVTVPEPVEVSQPRKKDPPHPIRVAKSIDVISRIVFPVGYFIFLFYFFATYRGFG